MIKTKIFCIKNYKVVITMRFLLYQIIVIKKIYMMLFKEKIDILWCHKSYFTVFAFNLIFKKIKN
jgi:hypothetical protein